ncbi:MAG: hypothetical protein ACE5QV_05360 [Fidelibacterota bacterium]
MMVKNKNRIFIIGTLSVLLLFFTILTIQCEKEEVLGPKVPARIEVVSEKAFLLVGKSDYTNITASLLTAKNKPFNEVMEITFMADIGYFRDDGGKKMKTKSVKSNTSGVASVILYPGNVPGKCVITAFTENVIDRDTVEFIISLPKYIEINAELDTLLVTGLNELDSTKITARVWDKFWNPISGLTVYLFTNQKKEYGTLAEKAIVTDDSGKVSTMFYTAIRSGKIEISAKVDTAYYGAIEGKQVINVLPGPPNKFVLDAPSPSELIAGSPEKSTIVANVRDLYFNYVPGIWVLFETTLGKISPDSNITYEAGKAIVELSAPADTIGEAIITARIPRYDLKKGKKVNIEVESVEIDTIVNELDVTGIGGVTDALIPVHVYYFGRTPAPGVKVALELVDPPAGADINGAGTVDTMVTDVNGEISVSLNSGTGSGDVVLRAKVRNRADKRKVAVISAGPPENIAVVPGNTSEYSSGFWNLEIAAEVRDVNGNFVEDNTPVMFSISDPLYALIEPQGYTFNKNLKGDSTHGIAYSKLTYSTFQAIHEVTITAVSNSAQGDSTFILPINKKDAILDISADPSAEIVFADTSAPCDTIIIVADLSDGHGSAVNNVTFNFSLSTAIGTLLDSVAVTGESPSPVHGRAEVRYQACPSDIPSGQSSATVKVKAAGVEVPLSKDLTITLKFSQ